MNKKIRDMVRGACGGALISAGAFFAIEYMENGVFPAILFVAFGVAVCIAAEYVLTGTSALCVIAAVMTACGALTDIRLMKYAAMGAVIYCGCALALPERNAADDALTALSAAAGFLAASALMLYV